MVTGTRYLTPRWVWVAIASVLLQVILIAHAAKCPPNPDRLMAVDVFPQRVINRVPTDVTVVICGVSPSPITVHMRKTPEETYPCVFKAFMAGSLYVCTTTADDTASFIGDVVVTQPSMGVIPLEAILKEAIEYTNPTIHFIYPNAIPANLASKAHIMISGLPLRGVDVLNTYQVTLGDIVTPIEEATETFLRIATPQVTGEMPNLRVNILDISSLPHKVVASLPNAFTFQREDPGTFVNVLSYYPHLLPQSDVPFPLNFTGYFRTVTILGSFPRISSVKVNGQACSTYTVFPGGLLCTVQTCTGSCVGQGSIVLYKGGTKEKELDFEITKDITYSHVEPFDIGPLNMRTTPYTLVGQNFPTKPTIHLYLVFPGDYIVPLRVIGPTTATFFLPQCVRNPDEKALNPKPDHLKTYDRQHAYAVHQTGLRMESEDGVKTHPLVSSGDRGRHPPLAAFPDNDIPSAPEKLGGSLVIQRMSHALPRSLLGSSFLPGSSVSSSQHSHEAVSPRVLASRTPPDFCLTGRREPLKIVDDYGNLIAYVTNVTFELTPPMDQPDVQLLFDDLQFGEDIQITGKFFVSFDVTFVRFVPILDVNRHLPLTHQSSSPNQDVPLDDLRASGPPLTEAGRLQKMIPQDVPSPRLQRGEAIQTTSPSVTVPVSNLTQSSFSVRYDCVSPPFSPSGTGLPECVAGLYLLELLNSKQEVVATKQATLEVNGSPIAESFFLFTDIYHDLVNDVLKRTEFVTNFTRAMELVSRLPSTRLLMNITEITAQDVQQFVDISSGNDDTGGKSGPPDPFLPLVQVGRTKVYVAVLPLPRGYLPTAGESLSLSVNQARDLSLRQVPLRSTSSSDAQPTNFTSSYAPFRLLLPSLVTATPIALLYRCQDRQFMYNCDTRNGMASIHMPIYILAMILCSICLLALFISFMLRRVEYEVIKQLDEDEGKG